MMPSLKYTYDDLHDVLMVEGVEYSGDLFRGLSGLQPGQVFEFIALANGILTVRVWTPKTPWYKKMLNLLPAAAAFFLRRKS